MKFLGTFVVGLSLVASVWCHQASASPPSGAHAERMRELRLAFQENAEYLKIFQGPEELHPVTYLAVVQLNTWRRVVAKMGSEEWNLRSGWYHNQLRLEFLRLVQDMHLSLRKSPAVERDRVWLDFWSELATAGYSLTPRQQKILRYNFYIPLSDYFCGMILVGVARPLK